MNGDTDNNNNINSEDIADVFDEHIKDFILWIASLSCSGVRREAAKIPSPPALDTAATNSGVVGPPAIPAWIIGY
jgi:hypothetical protein